MSNEYMYSLTCVMLHVYTLIYMYYDDNQAVIFNNALVSLLLYSSINSSTLVSMHHYLENEFILVIRTNNVSGHLIHVHLCFACTVHVQYTCTCSCIVYSTCTFTCTFF